MTVFMDTFAFIAWLNPRDHAYETVGAYLADFSGRIVTTEWVLVELVDAFSAPVNRELAVNSVRGFRVNPLFDIVPYDSAVYGRGFDLFAARPDKEWSLTDCISFAVMTDRKLTDALTADRHFTQAGFRAVFAP